MLIAEEKATAGVCHYRGVSYKVGDELTQITEDSPCKTNCRCVESAEQYVLKMRHFILRKL